MSWIGLGGQLVGAGIQSGAAAATNRDISGALQGDLQVQNKYARQALANFYDQLAKTSPDAYNAALQSGAAGRQAQYGQMAQVPLSTPQANRTSESPMRDANVNAMLGNVRSQLGGYGDAAQNTYLANQDAARQLAQIQNFAAGQHSVLPYSLYQAQHREDWLNSIGQLLSGLGGAANLSAMANTSYAPQGSLGGAGSIGQSGPGMMTNPSLGAVGGYSGPGIANMYGPMNWLNSPQTAYQLY